MPININKATIGGRLGADPEVRTRQNSDKIVTLSLATEESWKDGNGEWQKNTDWHRVVIFNQASANFAEKHLKKGSEVVVDGKIQTRSYDKDGETKYVTEIVVSGYQHGIQLAGKFNSEGSGQQEQGQSSYGNRPSADMPEDEIPFNGGRTNGGPAPRR